MNHFSNAREAKEFLISRIVEEAQREGVPLSEIERKMLYFSETGWTPPDMGRTSDEFDREYDQLEYEEKIARLIKKAARRARNEPYKDYDTWWAAIRFLNKQDHYISVMIKREGLRPPGDSLKLWGTGLALVCVFAGLFFLLSVISDKFNVDFERYVPTRYALGLYIWVTLVSVAILYGVARMIFGYKVDSLVGTLIEKLFGISARSDK